MKCDTFFKHREASWDFVMKGNLIELYPLYRVEDQGTLPLVLMDYPGGSNGFIS